MKVPTPRQLSSGNWFIYLRLGGEGIPVTERSRADCIRTAQLIKAEYLAGREIKKKKLPPAPDQTLRELLTSYIEKYRPVLSPSTVRGYCVIRDNRFKGVMDAKLRDVGSWQKVINSEMGKCSAKTLKSAWSLVRASLVDAGQPAPKVTLPQIVSGERPFLSAEEIRRFVAAVRGSAFEIPILLGLHGLRRSEIAALDWKQVDLKAGRIRVEGALVPDESGRYVRKQTNKNDASRRTVPIMIPELRAALEAVSEFDRTGPGKKPDNDRAVRALREGNAAELCRACGNVLMPAAAAIRPEIPGLCERLRALGAAAAEMTGSGAAVFGLFFREEDAAAAARELRGGRETVILTRL